LAKSGLAVTGEDLAFRQRACANLYSLIDGSHYPFMFRTPVMALKTGVKSWAVSLHFCANCSDEEQQQVRQGEYPRKAGIYYIYKLPRSTLPPAEVEDRDADLLAQYRDFARVSCHRPSPPEVSRSHELPPSQHIAPLPGGEECFRKWSLDYLLRSYRFTDSQKRRLATSLRQRDFERNCLAAFGSTFFTRLVDTIYDPYRGSYDEYKHSVLLLEDQLQLQLSAPLRSR
jgi:hypothetical protein